MIMSRSDRLFFGSIVFYKLLYHDKMFFALFCYSPQYSTHFRTTLPNYISSFINSTILLHYTPQNVSYYSTTRVPTFHKTCTVIPRFISYYSTKRLLSLHKKISYYVTNILQFCENISVILLTDLQKRYKLSSDAKKNAARH